MPRRTHKKSRHGCLECKRRHIKCNEARPICSNCSVSERKCEYALEVTRASRTADRDTHRFSAASPAISAPTQYDSGFSSPGLHLGTPPDPPANMLQVELSHHFYTEILPGLYKTKSQEWCLSIMPYIISCPYAINATLAFAALHLSIKRAERREYYRYHAASLQTHALAMFQETDLGEVDEETCVAPFFFSAVLGLHTLCDVLIYRENEFIPFLDKFVHFLRVYRGVRAICGKAWSFLSKSVLQSMLSHGEMLYRFDGHLGPPYRHLLGLVKAAKLGSELTKIYEQAIESLQTATNAIGTMQDYPENVHGSAAWPVLTLPEYVDLLMQRRPEALVILAHYGILLHFCREMWMFGDGGLFLIKSVWEYLGPDWAEWLEWPNKVLNGDVMSLHEFL